MRGPQPSSVPVPTLEGRWTRLRSLTPDDMNWLYAFSVLPEMGYRWRGVPGTMDPAQFSHQVSRGIEVQLVVEGMRNRQRVGVTLAYNADFKNRTAYIAAAFDPIVHGRGWHLEGVDLFIRYCFEAYDFRKLYAEVLDFNLPLFASVLGARAREEGRLRDHWWVGGRYWDVSIISFAHDDWQEGWGSRIREVVRRTVTPAGDVGADAR